MTLLCTWIIELKISIISETQAGFVSKDQRENGKPQIELFSKELINFMDENKYSIDTTSVLELLQSHGRIDEFI